MTPLYEPESIDYEHHLEFYRTLFQQDEKNTSEYVFQRAKESHALAICDPLQAIITRSMVLAEKLRNKEAAYYMQYGIGRRIDTIWYAYGSIFSLAHPERNDPLTYDEAQILNRDINLIYMFTRGALDNLVLCYLYEKEPNLFPKRKNGEINFGRIHLFNKDLKNNSTNPKLWEQLSDYQRWCENFLERRDPVAHRIPIYIIPSILTPDEAKTYQEMEKQANEVMKKMDLKLYDQLQKQMRELGKFPHVFSHHPDDQCDIYPTLPNDMANFIKIYDIFESALKQSEKQHIN